MSLTLSQKLERFPPVACRLLARRRTRDGRFTPLLDHELADRSGLAMAKIKALSWTCSWDGVPVDEMLAFTRACGVDLENRRTLWNHWRYLRSRNFHYLTSHPGFETLFLPLAEEYERHIKSQP